MRHKRTQKIVYLSLLAALAIVLHMVESSIPLPLPLGVKLGFANIISLVVIQIYGTKEMYIVNFFRVMISGLLTGTLMSHPFFISCGGVLLSSLILALLKRYTSLPIVSLSIFAAIGHNIGQIAVVSFFLTSIAMVPYLFILFASSIPTGIFTGLISIEIKNRIKIQN